MSHTGDKRAGQFSMGMKQRLGIAIALLNHPKLLILDEPTNGLDPLGIEEMRELIRSFPREGITVILSSHILSEVQQIADHIGIISHGILGYEEEIHQGEDSEFLKMRHSPLIPIHLLIPAPGALLLTAYTATYSSVAGVDKVRFFSELVAVVFPLVVGVICGIAVGIDENASSFQVMLSDKDGRILPYLSKLLACLILGMDSVVLLVAMSGIGIKLLNQQRLSMFTLLSGLAGLFLGYVPLYAIHQFVSMGFGMGVSVFIAVIESLFAILFSNVNSTLGVFFPATWGGHVMRVIIYGRPSHDGGLVFVLSLIIVLFPLLWFRRWEGRKSSD